MKRLVQLTTGIYRNSQLISFLVVVCVFFCGGRGGWLQRIPGGAKGTFNRISFVIDNIGILSVKQPI